MQNILVTGSAGFIGNCFAKRLIEFGNTVVSVDNLTYAGSPDNLKSIMDSAQHHFYNADINESKTISQLLEAFSIDWVVNFAAESHVDRSIDSPEIFIKSNVQGVCVLLDAFHKHWVKNGRPEHYRFLQISTDEVFGSCHNGEPFTEESRLAPNSPYAASKAGAEHLVRAYFKTHGLPVLVTNCSNNYGQYQHPEKLIPTIILNAINGRSIPVYGDGTQIRDWIHVLDHCKAILHILENSPVGESYVVGASCEIRNIDLVNKICSILDEHLPDRAPHNKHIDFVADRLGHDKRYAIDWSKLNSLGWSPSVPIDGGLASTVKWYLSNRDWADNVKT